MSFFVKDSDLNKPIRTFSYLKKGQRNQCHNKKKEEEFTYLKKGDGKLASFFHGDTNFASKRKEKVVEEQIKREKEFWIKKEENDSQDNDE